MDAYKVLRPLFYIAEIFCLIPFSFNPDEQSNTPFKSFNKSIFYSLRMLIILAVVVGSIIYKQVAITVYNSKSAIGNAVEFAHYNFRLIGTVCCVISMNFYNGHIVSFMNIIPNNLKQDIYGIGFNVNYKKVSSLSYMVVIVLFVKTVIMETPYILNGFYNNLISTLDFFIFNIPLLIIHLVSLQWIIYLTFLHIHLRTLNNILKALKYRRCWVVNDFVKKSTMSPIQTLKNCGNIYSNLCTGSKTINQAFGWQFLFMLPGFFIEIVLNSFNICQTIKNKTTLEAQTVVADLIHFVVILEIVIPCVIVKEEAGKLVDILVKIDLSYENNAEFEEVMSNIMLQVYHQKIEFSANGVFAIDGTLIYSILGALTTYLVILLQFDI